MAWRGQSLFLCIPPRRSVSHETASSRKRTLLRCSPCWLRELTIGSHNYTVKQCRTSFFWKRGTPPLSLRRVHSLRRGALECARFGMAYQFQALDCPSLYQILGVSPDVSVARGHAPTSQRAYFWICIAAWFVNNDGCGGGCGSCSVQWRR
jgi:hypothetical protein